MSMKLSDLSVLAYANNFTLWHYKTDDDSVITSNYFDIAADMVNPNDLIIATIDTDGIPATQFYIVSAVNNGAVTVAAYS
jgi:pyridoxine/pyridoxamine 5'-phosphate oxidase